MRPEFAVGIPEAITDIFAGIAITLAIMALYTDICWLLSSETSMYYQGYLVWVEENGGWSEMSAFRRDPFYQLVVTVFIAPTVIHLTIHLIVTIVQKYPEEAYELDDLDTPDEDPEFLNATPVTFRESPAMSPRNASRTSQNVDTAKWGSADRDRHFIRWVGHLLCSNSSKADKSGSHFKSHAKLRRCLSLPAGTSEPSNHKGREPLKIFWSSPALPPPKNVVTEPPCKLPSALKQTESAPHKACTIGSTPGSPSKIEADSRSKTSKGDEDINVAIDASTNNKPSHTSLVEPKFMNPRLLKLLLMASIIFECMLAFSASYYQVNELLRFDDYLQSPNVTGMINSSDTYLAQGALMLATCRHKDPGQYMRMMIKYPKLRKERDKLCVCQQYRAKAWVVVFCSLYGISGLITTVVIYGQFRDTLALTYGGNYPVMNRRTSRRHAWGSTDASTQEESDLRRKTDYINTLSAEEMQRRYRRDSFSEDEKLFSGYTVGMDADLLGGGKVASNSIT